MAIRVGRERSIGRCLATSALALVGAWPGVALAAPAKIGVIVPLTGAQAWAGREIELTSRTWAAQLNATKAAGGPPVVELLVLDDKSGAEGARAAARQALAQGVAVIMNCFGNVACTAIAQETRSAALPLIGAIASDDRLRGADYPQVFTTRGGVREEIDALLKYLDALGNTSVAVLYQDDEFGQAYRKAFDASAATRKAIHPVSRVAVDPQATQYDAVAAAALVQPTAATLLLAEPTHALGVMEAMNRRGYRGLYLNPSSQANPVFVAQAAEWATKSKLVVAFVTTTPSPWLAAPSIAAYRDIVGRGAPASWAPSHLGLESFMNAALSGIVVRRDPRPTPDAVARVFQSLAGVGVAGMTVRYDPQRRRAVLWLDLAVVTRDGKVRSN